MFWFRAGLAGILALFAASVGADGSTPAPNDSLVVEAIESAMGSVSDKIIASSIQWLAAFMALQFVITNYKLIPHAELDTVFAKFVGSLAWFGVCWYILGAGAEFIEDVGGGIYDKYGPGFPSPSAILATTIGLVAGLATIAIGGGVFSATFGQLILYVVIGLALIGLYFAVKLYLLQLELALIVMLAPLSFSLLGLNALKDQGIVPFKSLLSLVYRIIIYGVIFAGYNGLAGSMAAVVGKYASATDLLSVVQSGWLLVKAVFALLIGYVLLAMMLFKSDSIAASLASGSTNLGPSDVAGAAMAGAAAGAALQGVAQAATKPAQSLSDMTNKLFGRDGGGMRNVSTEGAADVGGGLLKPEPISASLSDMSGGAGRGGAPSASPAAPVPSSPPPSPGMATGREFGGVPNNPGDSGGRDAARDAAREARRAERAGSGANAGIEGGLGQKVGELVDALSKPKERGVGERLGNWHREVGQEKASTHVSINTHQD